MYTLITAGLLLVAIVAAFFAKHEIDEAQRANREATRPYVIVTVESTGTSRQLFDLCIRNIGQRPAFNVEVDLDPPPVSADTLEGYEIANAKMLSEPIAMIAPAQVMKAYYDSHRDRKDAKGLPSSHKVTLKYEDSSGHVYEETSVVDIDAMRGALYVDEKTIHNVAKSLDDIKKTLKAASVLKGHGDIAVEAVIEARPDHKKRVKREQYDCAVEQLDAFREQGARGPAVSYLERVVADYEKEMNGESNPLTSNQ